MSPTADPSAVRRGPGRPPDLAKREAVLAATREVLAEVGYTSMTIDAVAQRAGSNRVLIYRVWDTKLALAADALFGTSFKDWRALHARVYAGTALTSLKERAE